MMRKIIIAALWPGLLLIFPLILSPAQPVQAQDDDPTCDPDGARVLLETAQFALVNGDLDGAYFATRRAAELLEGCVEPVTLVPTEEAPPETAPTEAPATEAPPAEGTPVTDATPLPPLPPSNNEELRQQHTDEDLALTIQPLAGCYEQYTEIPLTISVTSYKEDPNFRFYVDGGILFSINNTPLLQTGPVIEPFLRDQIIQIEFFDTYDFDFEDLGLFLRGVDPEELEAVDIVFGQAADTGFGLPPGNYRITAGYTNPHDGLTPQADGTFLTPFALWRGTLVSREQTFRVVQDAALCDSDPTAPVQGVIAEPTAEPTAQPTAEPGPTATPTVTATPEPVLCTVQNTQFAQVPVYADRSTDDQIATMQLNQQADVAEVYAYADGERWLRVNYTAFGSRFTGWILRDRVEEVGVPCPEFGQ